MNQRQQEHCALSSPAAAALLLLLCSSCITRMRLVTRLTLLASRLPQRYTVNSVSLIKTLRSCDRRWSGDSCRRSSRLRIQWRSRRLGVQLPEFTPGIQCFRNTHVHRQSAVSLSLELELDCRSAPQVTCLACLPFPSFSPFSLDSTLALSFLMPSPLFPPIGCSLLPVML